jgi:hypothetical protein
MCIIRQYIRAYQAVKAQAVQAHAMHARIAHVPLAGTAPPAPAWCELG